MLLLNLECLCSSFAWVPQPGPSSRVSRTGVFFQRKTKTDWFGTFPNRSFVSKSELEMIARAFISSCFNYCVFTCLNQKRLFQCVQRLNSHRADITQLHWLPVHLRVHFKCQSWLLKLLLVKLLPTYLQSCGFLNLLLLCTPHTHFKSRQDNLTHSQSCL